MTTNGPGQCGESLATKKLRNFRTPYLTTTLCIREHLIFCSVFQNLRLRTVHLLFFLKNKEDEIFWSWSSSWSFLNLCLKINTRWLNFTIVTTIMVSSPNRVLRPAEKDLEDAHFVFCNYFQTFVWGRPYAIGMKFNAHTVCHIFQTEFLLGLIIPTSTCHRCLNRYPTIAGDKSSCPMHPECATGTCQTHEPEWRRICGHFLGCYDLL